jgi:putative intracellular protease/amidase
MQIVIPLFDGFNVLDATGPYEVLRHLPEAQLHFAASRRGPIADAPRACTLQAEVAFTDVPSPDVIVVPGGQGRLNHMHEGPVRAWLLEADKASTWTTSVCTGALILAGAGLLKDRAATTHWRAMDELPAFGARPRRERYVFDGKYVTPASRRASTCPWPSPPASRTSRPPGKSSKSSNTIPLRPSTSTPERSANPGPPPRPLSHDAPNRLAPPIPELYRYILIKQPVLIFAMRMAHDCLRRSAHRASAGLGRLRGRADKYGEMGRQQASSSCAIVALHGFWWLKSRLQTIVSSQNSHKDESGAKRSSAG